MFKKYGHKKSRLDRNNGNWYDSLIINFPNNKIYGKIVVTFKQNVWIPQDTIVKNIDMYVRPEKLKFIEFLEKSK